MGGWARRGQVGAFSTVGAWADPMADVQLGMRYVHFVPVLLLLQNFVPLPTDFRLFACKNASVFNERWTFQGVGPLDPPRPLHGRNGCCN